MLILPSMLLEAAEKAGIKVPPGNVDKDFDADEYPHFAVFCNAQLCRRMQPGEHWENAVVIAAIPDAEIKTISMKGLMARGFA